jgi:hypothetical protein
VVSVSALGVLAAKSAHRVTGVATFILLTDIGNQRLWTLHFALRAAISASSTSTTTCPVFP